LNPTFAFAFAKVLQKKPEGSKCAALLARTAVQLVAVFFAAEFGFHDFVMFQRVEVLKKHSQF